MRSQFFMIFAFAFSPIVFGAAHSDRSALLIERALTFKSSGDALMTARGAEARIDARENYIKAIECYLSAHNLGHETALASALLLSEELHESEEHKVSLSPRPEKLQVLDTVINLSKGHDDDKVVLDTTFNEGVLTPSTDLTQALAVHHGDEIAEYDVKPPRIRSLSTPKNEKYEEGIAFYSHAWKLMSPYQKALSSGFAVEITTRHHKKRTAQIAAARHVIATATHELRQAVDRFFAAFDDANRHALIEARRSYNLLKQIESLRVSLEENVYIYQWLKNIKLGIDLRQAIVYREEAEEALMEFDRGSEKALRTAVTALGKINKILALEAEQQNLKADVKSGKASEVAKSELEEWRDRFQADLDVRIQQ